MFLRRRPPRGAKRSEKCPADISPLASPPCSPPAGPGGHPKLRERCRHRRRVGRRLPAYEPPCRLDAGKLQRIARPALPGRAAAAAGPPSRRRRRSPACQKPPPVDGRRISCRRRIDPSAGDASGPPSPDCEWAIHVPRPGHGPRRGRGHPLRRQSHGESRPLDPRTSPLSVHASTEPLFFVVAGACCSGHRRAGRHVVPHSPMDLFALRVARRSVQRLPTCAVTPCLGTRRDN